MPLAIAAEQTLATLRSTTLVNSSKTTRGCRLSAVGSRLDVLFEGQSTAPGFAGGSWWREPPAEPGADRLVARARAKSQRKRSPLLRTWYGLIHDGGDPKPTAVNNSTTW